MDKDFNLIRLGKNIRDIRKQVKISQEQLALIAEVDRSYIGGIERGERNVTILTLIKLAECLKCNVSDFTNGLPSYGNK